MSRPPATKIDEPAPVPPAEVVEQAPTIRGAMPNQGGPASRKPQADAKPAEMGSPVEVGQAPPGNMPQASAGRVPQPVPVEASSAGTPPLPSPQPAALEPQLSWKTVAACFDCGAVIPPDAHFCAGCGRPIGSRPKKATGGAVIEVVTEGGKIGDVYPIFRGDLIIGRIEGDVTFPHDGYMSSRHARIMERDGQYFLSDESSRNGTFVRIRGEIELKPGDTFLVGKQVLKFDKK
ncbi:MAG TPA: FHA domain-containing protein [Blastocatellia bacterium]|nr:FHA domain-containing protein [Blastocatellia bacterium]